MKIGIYKHFKWWLYKVLYLAKETEKLEEVVVYKNINNNQIWIRKKKEFFEKIKRNSINIPRFKYIWNETYKNY